MLRASSLALSTARLSSPAISAALLHLPGWARDGNRQGTLIKSFVFKDFVQAKAFMDSLTDFINDSNHHPEWTNVYNKVSVRLTTHDAGNTITEKDIKLATRMEQEAKKILA